MHEGPEMKMNIHSKVSTAENFWTMEVKLGMGLTRHLGDFWCLCYYTGPAFSHQLLRPHLLGRDKGSLVETEAVNTAIQLFVRSQGPKTDSTQRRELSHKAVNKYLEANK